MANKLTDFVKSKEFREYSKRLVDKYWREYIKKTIKPKTEEG